MMVDTGSPLTWVALEKGDNDLPEHKSGRMDDGDGYEDGQQFEGTFRYGLLSLECDGACLDEAAVLIVSDSIKYPTRGVMGLSLRMASPFKIDGIQVSWSEGCENLGDRSESAILQRYLSLVWA
jgi:hypothetical protein